MTEWPPFAVTVDLAVFTIRDDTLSVLLVRRGSDPYAGSWALPGGFVEVDEDAATAARRELAEETGVAEFGGHLEQLATYSDPRRDPRQRVVSIAHLAFAPDIPDPTVGSDAAEARWWAVDELVGDDGPALAFDHGVILADALERVRSKLEYTTLATQFVEEPFTLGQLRRVYAAVWGTAPGLDTFRRKVLSTNGFVVAVEPEDPAAAEQGALLFRRGAAMALQPPLMRPGAAPDG